MQKHRGKNPKDDKLFSEKNTPALRGAVADLSMLLSKGYALNSSMKLVGDRFDLIKRQRFAVEHSVCSDEALKIRKSKKLSLNGCKGELLLIDGFNLIITVEAALSGGYIFIGRDGTYRDIASVHGTYKKVEESGKAIELIGELLNEAGIVKVKWLLDSPVSNSGKLKQFILGFAEKYHCDWEVELVLNPDNELIESNGTVVSSDSLILDSCRNYIDLAGVVIEKSIRDANIVDLRIE